MKNDTSIPLRLSVVDYERPTVPQLGENYGRGSQPVPYGDDNHFPDFLQICRRKSATLGTIINGFVDYILGDGIEVGQRAGAFAQEVNRRHDTLEDLVRQIAEDYTTYGGFAVQVIYSKMGTVAELYALDFAKVRSSKYNDVIYYYPKGTLYSSDRKQYPRFDLDKRIGVSSQIYYFKNGSRMTYPTPMYVGALDDIQTEINCSQYNLTSISRGFMARYIFNLPDNGSLTDEQKGLVEQGIKEKFCGADVDTNFMLHWTLNGERLEAEKLDSDDTNERYITVKRDARENIYTAFRATPNLFGLPSETTGFNAQEYSQAFKLFQKTVIRPMQKEIERVFAKIFNDENAIHIQPFTITFDE